MLIIGFYLVAVNIAAYWAFVFDKTKARAGVRRTPESTLLRYALMGGSVGAIAAQQIIRHKTRKEPFRAQLWAIAAMQVLLIVGFGMAVFVLGVDTVQQWIVGQIG